METINVLKPFYRTEEILDEIKLCLDKSWTGLGYKTDEFENAWKEYTNLPNAHFLNSATSGLHLALNIFKDSYHWEDGDEIITTPLTFVSTNHAILYENLKPVFADVDEHLCLDPKSIESKITSKTRAVMFVGIGGNTGNLKEISQLCKHHNLKLILDAAHMAGTKIRNVFDGAAFSVSHVGDEADVSVFSFQAVKNLSTADSGMICFKDDEFDKKVRKLSWLGIDKNTFDRTNSKGSYKWKYDVPSVGFKYHGNSIMAAIGLVQLKYLDEDNDKLNQLASIYDDALEHRKNVKLIPISNYCDKSSRHLYQIRVPSTKRDKIIQKFHKNNIYPGVHYVINTNYPMYRYGFKTCPVAEQVSDELISLPLHRNLKEEDIQRVIKVLGRRI